MINQPSMDISVNFPLVQKEICYECYHEVCNVYNSFFSPENRMYNIFESDGVDCYSDGWYFTIYISLDVPELIVKIMEKILEYKPKL